MKIIYIILFIFCIFNCYALIAQQELDTNKIDIINRIDTIALKQDTILKDTNIYYPFSNYRGSLLYATDYINYKDIPTKNYFFITDILTQYLPINPLFTTITGNCSAFSFFGAMPTENIAMISGIAVNDFYGNTNLDYISPEFANNIEILYGSSAVLKTGKSGLAVNIQPFIYNTNKPYTKIWYSQGDNKLIGVDGIYSQNLLPNWNITGGFKRISSNSYYQNSFIDMWNARLMLSFQQSNQSAFSLLYHFTNFYTGDFGGISFEDYGKNNNIVNQVRPNFTDLTDRQYKTNLIFSHSYHSIDSNLIINSNAFFYHLENNIYYKNEQKIIEFLNDSSGKNISSGYNYGFNTSLKHTLSNLLSINAGLECNYNNIVEPLQKIYNKNFGNNIFGYSIYTISSLNFGKTDISVGGRYGLQYDKNVFSLGTNITNYITKKMFLIADVSYLKTAPNPIFDKLSEKHLLSTIEISYDSVLSFNVFYRNITDQIRLIDKNDIYEFSAIGNKNTLLGGTIKTNIKLPYNFQTILLVSEYIDIYNNVNENNTGKKNNSNCLYATLSLEYTYQKNSSSIVFGVNGSLLHSENKYYFSPFVKNYVRTDLNEGLEFDGISAYIKAKLGNCYLRINFKNILGLNYSYLAYYPILKQEFCLSLTWAFPY
jgi:hypothetical protein